MNKINATYQLIIILLITGMIYPATTDAQSTRPVIMQRQQQDAKKMKEQRAMNYYRNRQYDKAAAIYKELFDESPRNHYYSYYFNSLVFLSDYKTADKLVKRQLKASPNNYRYTVDQIYLYDQTGNEKKANRLMKQLLSDLPGIRNQVIQIASSLEGKGYYKEALEVYEKSQSIPGRNDNYNMEKARVYHFTGEYGLMFDAYLTHLDIKPEDMQLIKNRMQSIMRQDVEDNLSGILKTKLLEKAQADPDNLIYAEMLLWHVMQTKDFEMAFRQARAIDMRFDNREDEMLEVADICYINKQYEIAAQAYGYLKDKKEDSPFYPDAYTGYFLSLVKMAETDPNMDVRQYRSLIKTGNKAIEELGLNKGTIEIAGNMAHITAFQLNEYDEALEMLEKALEVGNLSAIEKSRLKLEFADILLFKDEVWDATLLYSQIEHDMKNEPIGHEAKFRNARLFYFIGEYIWAQAKLDILKSATSKLIANDAMELSLFIKDVMDEDTTGQALKKFGAADLFIYRDAYDSAIIMLDEVAAKHAGFYSYQYLIYKKAGMMETAQDYQQADSLYALLAGNYPESIKADNAIFKRAEIQRVQLKNDELAMELYMILMTAYPESIYAGEARKKYREMRGDEEFVN